PSGRSAALPADHDDDVRGLVRCTASDAGLGRRLGAATSARPCDRRRPACEPIAHAVYDAGHLSGARSGGGKAEASLRCAFSPGIAAAGACARGLRVNLSAPFVRRPIGTILMTIGLALAGAAAYFQLPVSPLPQIDIPTISVSASLAGASPD